MAVLKRTVKQEHISESLRKNLLLAALEKHLGLFSPAGKSANVTLSEFKSWYANDDRFRERVDALQETTLDFAEAALYKKIQAGDTASIIFFLKSKGKKRGYEKKMEMHCSGSLLLQDDISDDSLVDIVKKVSV